MHSLRTGAEVRVEGHESELLVKRYKWRTAGRRAVRQRKNSQRRFGVFFSTYFDNTSHLHKSNSRLSCKRCCETLSINARSIRRVHYVIAPVSGVFRVIHTLHPFSRQRSRRREILNIYSAPLTRPTRRSMADLPKPASRSTASKARRKNCLNA